MYIYEKHNHPQKKCLYELRISRRRRNTELLSAWYEWETHAPYTHDTRKIYARSFYEQKCYIPHGRVDFSTMCVRAGGWCGKALHAFAHARSPLALFKSARAFESLTPFVA